MQVSEKILGRLQREVSVSINQLSALQSILDELFQESNSPAGTPNCDERITFQEKPSRFKPRMRNPHPAGDDAFNDIVITSK